MDEKESADRYEGYKNIQRLFSVPYWDGKTSFGLESPRLLLEALGNPQDKIQTVHVAGTNGKGSVCSYLAAIFKASGKKAAQFSSPHLVDVTERFLLDDKPVSYQQLDQSLAMVFDAAEKLQLSPSYFEIVTAAGFLIFAQAKVDIALIEVGLGGRLDATNCIAKPRLSIITSISLDHTLLLGDSLAKIAREKAGIIKQRADVVLGKMPVEAKNEIQKIADSFEAKVYAYGEEFCLDDQSRELCFDDQKFDFGLGALNGYQPLNASVAARAAMLLGVDKRDIVLGLSKAVWPGRLEMFSLRDGQLQLLIDCAHNPEGLAALLIYLEQEIQRSAYQTVTFVLSFLSTKDWPRMIEMLRVFEKNSSAKINFVFTCSEHASAVDPAELLQSMGQGVASDAAMDIFQETVESSEMNSLIVLCGSMYLIGGLRELCRK